MANYAITAALVRTSVVPKRATAAVDITAGQSLYQLADLTVGLYDANSVTVLVHTFLGIAVNGASAGQPVLYVDEDPLFTPGCVLAIGDSVIGSATPGAIAPDADGATGWFKTFLGMAISVTQMSLKPLASGAAKL
jgi:hypothetical protein